jgi:multidrug efflux system membrane fusion protein
VIALPVSALRDESRVAVVDADGHLRFREVEVVRRERDRVLVGAGLEGGERVCVSPLPVAVEGMPVRIADEGGEDAPPPEPERRRGAGEAAS